VTLVCALSFVLGVLMVPFLNVKANAVLVLGAEALLSVYWAAGAIDGWSLIVYSAVMVAISQLTYFLCVTLTSMVAFGRVRRKSNESHEYDF
jgi:hypothetical protein